MPHFVRESNIESSFTELRDSEVGRRRMGTQQLAASNQSSLTWCKVLIDHDDPLHQHMLEIDSPLYELQSGG